MCQYSVCVCASVLCMCVCLCVAVKLSGRITACSPLLEEEEEEEEKLCDFIRDLPVLALCSPKSGVKMA